MGEAWINGEYRSDEAINISARDVGILRGYGVFDYLRTYGNEPFHLKDHLRRFFRSAEMMHLKINYTLEEIEEILRELVRRNGYEESSIRMVCLGGESPSSMMPTDKNTLYLLVEPYKGSREELLGKQKEGISLITFPHLRYKADVKTNNYIPAMDALREAESRGAFDALYCGQNGEIYETTRANVFFRINGKWITPKENILVGITRSVIMGLIPPDELVEAPLTIDDLTQTEEAFMSSSTKEIIPIIRINDTTVGTGHPGPETVELIKKFNEYIADPALWVKRQEEHPYGTI